METNHLGESLHLLTTFAAGLWIVNLSDLVDRQRTAVDQDRVDTSLVVCSQLPGMLHWLRQD